MLIGEDTTVVTRLMECVSAKFLAESYFEAIRRDAKSVHIIMLMHSMIGAIVLVDDVRNNAPSFVTLFEGVTLRNLSDGDERSEDCCQRGESP